MKNLNHILKALTIILCGAAVTPALAINRYWNGSNSGLWSDPGNWSPNGAPAAADVVYFGRAPDAHRTTMTNDLIGLQAGQLRFEANDYTIYGNTLTVGSGIFGDVDAETDNSFTVTIYCPLVFQTGGVIDAETGDGAISQSTEQLRLYGGLTVNAGNLSIQAHSYGSGPFGGCNGKIYVSAKVSGNGSVFAFANESAGNISIVQFDGTVSNSFAGPLDISTQGQGQIILAKTSAVSAPNGIKVDSQSTANLVIGGTGNQIGDQSTVSVSGGGTLNISGNNVTVGTLSLSNAPGDVGPSQINSSVLIGLNLGISASPSTQGNQSINGNLNLNGFLNVNVTGGPQPFTINGNIEGNGFEKTGSGGLQLHGNNTFFGDMEISAGTVQPLTAQSFGQPTAPYGVELNGGTLQIQGINVPSENLYVWNSNSLFLAIDSCVWNGPVSLTQDLHLSAWAASTNGLSTTFNGAISGTAGIYLQPVVVGSSPASQTVIFAGSTDNTFTGTLTVNCQLAEFGKSSGNRAFNGPLVVGSANNQNQTIARWLGAYQHVGTILTLYGNGVVNLNNFNEDFDAVTFNGGTVNTGNGQFAIYDTLTVNPAASTATINGYLGLPPGNNAVFNVGSGTTPLAVDLQVNAVMFGSAPYFVKQGPGTMFLTGANTFGGATLLEEGMITVGNQSAMSTTPIVIFNGATLNIGITCTLNQGMEILGAGVGGTNGAIFSPSSMPVLTGSILMDGATTINVGGGAGLELDGVIYGTGPLIKTGIGYLNIAGSSANTFSGDTMINEGTAYLFKSAGPGGNASAVPGNLVIGTKSSQFSGSTIATVADYGSYQLGPGSANIGVTVTVNGGSLYDLNGQFEQVTNVVLNEGGSIHTESGLLGLNGNVMPTLTVNPGLSASVVSGNVRIPSGCTFNVGGRSHFVLNAPPELDMQAAVSGNGSGSLTKIGGGRLRLSTNNTYTIPTIVNEGILEVDGAQSQSQVQVNGGKLQGTGTVGPISMTASASSVSPGVVHGILTSGNFGSVGGSGILNVELDGTSPGTSYNQLKVLGTVNLSGVTLGATLNFSSATNDQFTIIDNDGGDAVIGTFNNLPQNRNVYIGGQLFQITYTGGTGNDVVLKHLPTPPPPTLALQKISPNAVRLVWPTNNPPFSLQVSTNLGNSGWASSAILPVVVGGNNIVTNSIASGTQQFYRLSNP